MSKDDNAMQRRWIKEACMTLKKDITVYTVSRYLQDRGDKVTFNQRIGFILRTADYLESSGKTKQTKVNIYRLKPKPLYDENMIPIQKKVQDDNEPTNSRCVGGIDDPSDNNLLISQQCKIKELNEELAWIEIHKMVEDSKELD
jgi:hypothetical protein